MASPTTPTHGKYGAIYRRRPNGFKGDGLNDLTWGAGYSGAGASAYFEVMIDGEGAPDTFKWRKDGGAWTTGVSITGAAQTLSNSQTATFAATTGHANGDQWVIGNLDSEAATESGQDAQITASAKRLLNPNSPPAFTDGGGANVVVIDYVRGKAAFDANVGTVTVSGNNGYIVEASLEQVGYLRNWQFTAEVEMADMSYMGLDWKKGLPGMAGGEGSAGALFIGGDSFFDGFEQAAGQADAYYLLQLFNYDPDQDQTGDHLQAWVTFSGLNPNAPIGELTAEEVSFQLHGIPSFVADS